MDCSDWTQAAARSRHGARAWQVCWLVCGAVARPLVRWLWLAVVGCTNSRLANSILVFCCCFFPAGRAAQTRSHSREAMKSSRSLSLKAHAMNAPGEDAMLLSLPPHRLAPAQLAIRHKHRTPALHSTLLYIAAMALAMKALSGPVCQGEVHLPRLSPAALSAAAFHQRPARRTQSRAYSTSKAYAGAPAMLQARSPQRGC